MADLDIKFYLSVILRRLHWIAAIVTLCTIGGLAVALMLPPIYRATAKILIETPEIPAEMARSTVPTSAIQQFQIIQQELTTKETLLDLSQRLNVYPQSATVSRDSLATDMRNRILFYQIPIEQLTPGGAVMVFELSFDAGDPNLAAAVTNRLTDMILERNQQERAGRAGETTAFFQREMVRLQSDLAKADAEILKFKNEHANALPDGANLRSTLQENQQERLGQINREEASLLSRRRNLVQLFQLTGRVGGAAPLSPEQQIIADLNRALAEQLTVFAEDSPNILALRARLAALQGQQAKVAKAADSGKKQVTELDLQLAEIDERLADLRHEKPIIQESLAALTKAVSESPANETKLNAMQRVRDNLQAQFKVASTRLGDAATGEQIERTAKGGRISIIESATPPEKRIGPDRRRIAIMGFLGGIGLATLLMGMLEFLNQTVRRPSELANLLQTEPLSVLPYIETTPRRLPLVDHIRNLLGPLARPIRAA